MYTITISRKPHLSFVVDFQYLFNFIFWFRTKIIAQII